MTVITDDRHARRFETTVDGHHAELVYHLSGDRLVLVHTGVPDELGGQGIGGRLVEAAVARAAAEGLTIVPSCSYARHWLDEHRDELGDVEVDWDGAG
ncbi:MAG: acetyltransferase [Acidimicrobiales bacterium]|nr:acetyltransferase [Acidimicrobiales bacterium]